MLVWPIGKRPDNDNKAINAKDLRMNILNTHPTSSSPALRPKPYPVAPEL